MMGPYYGMGGWSWLAGLLGLGLFLGLATVLVILVISLWRRSGFAQTKAPRVDRSAREILEIRYARGELTRDEFKRMTEDLSQLK